MIWVFFKKTKHCHHMVKETTTQTCNLHINENLNYIKDD